MSGPGNPPQRKNTADNVGRTVIIWTIIISVIVLVVVLVANDNDDEVSISGGGLFGSAGSGQLVERLDAAADAQRICYGWEIDSDLPGLSPGFYTGQSTPSYPALPTPTLSVPSVPGASPSPSPSPGTLAEEAERRLRELPTYVEQDVDMGSNLGAGVDPRQNPERCPRWVVFTADYYYDSIEEEWTSVTQGIETNLPLQLSPTDLREAGITEVDLLGDQATARLADAIGALPMIVAEKGAAPPVPQVNAQTPPAGDKISPPGTARYVWMGIGAVLVAGGLIWIIIAAVRSRRSA